MNKTDPELLALIKSNPEKGFSEFVENYSKRIYFHIRGMVYDHDDANDLTQNTFIKIYKNIEQFKGNSQLFSWIYRIATNEALHFLKKKAKLNNLSLEELSFNQASELTSDPYFDGDKADVLLQKALTKLPEKQRLVFQMKYFEEMKYQQISEILDTSVGALKASYHHAVKKIEDYVQKNSNLN